MKSREAARGGREEVRTKEADIVDQNLEFLSRVQSTRSGRRGRSVPFTLAVIASQPGILVGGSRAILVQSRGVVDVVYFHGERGATYDTQRR